MTWNNFYASITYFEIMLHGYMCLLEDEQRLSVGELVDGGP